MGGHHLGHTEMNRNTALLCTRLTRGDVSTLPSVIPKSAQIEAPHRK